MRTALAATLFFALCGCVASASEAPPTYAETAQQSPVILAVFAHPDDELFIGPALASAARDGAEVRIAYATSGDRGPGESGLEAGAELASLREGEARCASAALGLGDPIFWRGGDGTLAESARSAQPGGAAMLAQISALIDETRPDLVVTWGPDGGYGHADHRMISALVTQAVQARAKRPLLLYPGFKSGTLPPILQQQGWAATEPSLLAIRAPYAPDDLAATARAVQCHKSQFTREVRAGLVPLFDASVWQGAVYFRDALGSSAREDGLFLTR